MPRLRKAAKLEWLISALSYVNISRSFFNFSSQPKSIQHNKNGNKQITTQYHVRQTMKGIIFFHSSIHSLQTKAAKAPHSILSSSEIEE